MADYDAEQGGLSRAEVVSTALIYTGGVIGAVAVVAGVYSLWRLGQAEEPAGLAVVYSLMGLFGGIGLGALLWGLGEVLRRLVAVESAAERAAARPWTSGRGSRSEARGALADSPLLEELVVLMREVRDISLLSEQQRALRLEAQGKAVLGLLQREVPVLLREHNWIEARNRVQEARERFPSFREWDELEKQIEQMRAQVEAHDIEAAQRQIDDLTSLGAWDRVSEVINELLQRHPDSAKANELAQRIRAQRNKAEAEQRARLMAQAQDAANRREWKTALSLALTVIQRFPKSPEAQALRMQLPTLRENAEIQARQRMEAEIRDLIKARRFDEALRITDELIQQYPNSPQAAVLREQLPRLEEKAAAMGRR